MPQYFQKKSFIKKMKIARKKNMLHEAPLPFVFPEEKQQPIGYILHLCSSC